VLDQSFVSLFFISAAAAILGGPGSMNPTFLTVGASTCMML